MPGESTFTSAQAIFKRVHGKMIELVPTWAVLQQKYPFSTGVMVGLEYQFPVSLAEESGFTYGGENGEVLTLNDAEDGVLRSATVKPTSLYLRSRMTYEAVSRAMEQGDQAFESMLKYKLDSTNQAMRRRLEVTMIHGRSAQGIGVVQALAGQDITITYATWAGGIWSGAERTRIDVYPNNSNTVRQANLQVTAINHETRTITVTGTTTGIVAGDVIYYRGARTSGVAGFNEMPGLKQIMSNTGVLFGIDAAQFSQWRGNQFDVAGPLTFDKMQKGMSLSVNKGFMGRTDMYVSPDVFTQLNTDQAALRAYDASYTPATGKNGFEKLIYHGVSGQVNIEVHPYMMNGDAFAIPGDYVRRIGSKDISATGPGKADLPQFERIQGTNIVEYQLYTDQGLFVDKPCWGTRFFGIAP